MANDAYNFCVKQSENSSLSLWLENFLAQTNQLQQIELNSFYSDKTKELVKEYKKLVEGKVSAIEELIVIDKNYLLTLPGVALLQREKDEKIGKQRAQNRVGKAVKGKQAPKLDAILQRRFIKKEDWSCADLTSDEEELCLANMNHFDSQVHKLIFLKMMMEEIPRKP